MTNFDRVKHAPDAGAFNRESRPRPTQTQIEEAVRRLFTNAEHAGELKLSYLDLKSAATTGKTEDMATADMFVKDYWDGDDIEDKDGRLTGFTPEDFAAAAKYLHELVIKIMGVDLEAKNS
ncbi:MAG TPA: hypothetical protein VJH75_04900 [Patescibacteria group bacterium]|nr:hypothetical protein [Patescibacteria group bacterium]